MPVARDQEFFTCDEVTEDIAGRAASGDLHLGLPLWGRGSGGVGAAGDVGQAQVLAECQAVCAFLEASGLSLAWRPARMLPDDFCWQFCDDDTLQLEFSLGAGSYATALLAELVQYKEGCVEGGVGSEQD